MSDHKYSEKLYQAIVSDNMEEVNQLLKEGGNLDAPRNSSLFLRMIDSENIYPLEIACKTSKEMADALLDAGASVDIVDNYLSGTPLIYALSADYGERFEVAQRLIDAGADINHVDDNGRTAVNEAAIVLTKDDEQTRQEEYRIMLYLLENCDLEQIIEKSRSNPLVEAARFNNTKIMEYILENGYLDINCTAEGYTPLMRAVLSGSVEACRLLLEKGADVSIVSPTGKTAYEYAREKGNEEITDLLTDFM